MKYMLSIGSKENLSSIYICKAALCCGKSGTDVNFVRHIMWVRGGV